jgi:xyloglucan-specific exo-beta-1,4-glucanase
MNFNQNTAHYPVYSAIYYSSNKGVTWTQTNLTQIAQGPNGSGTANDSYRNRGAKIAIDPTNPASVYASEPCGGLYYSSDSGNTWAQVSTSLVPIAQTRTTGGGNECVGYSGMVMDNSHNLYVYSYGNGTYKCSSNTSCVKLTTGTGPSDIYWATVDYNTGDYYAIEGGGNTAPNNSDGNLWVWNGTTWGGSPSISGNASVVAVDPNNSGHVIAIDSQGNPDETFNSGTSWSGFSTTNNGSNINSWRGYTNDVGWWTLNGAFQPTWMQFDRTTAKILHIVANGDFWTNTAWSGNIVSGGSGTQLIWNSQGRGIEQLTGNMIIVPKTNTPIAAFWDFGYNLPTMPPAAYPTATYIWSASNGAIAAVWSEDYASSNPAYTFAFGDGNYGNGPTFLYYSSNYGASPTSVTPPANTQNAGNIAASTPDNVLIGVGQGNAPYYTTNFTTSQTWAQITLPGSPSFANFLQGFGTNEHLMCADRINANTFYLALPLASGVTNIYDSTNGGASWTLQNSASLTTFGGSTGQIECNPLVANDLWVSDGNGGNCCNQPGGGGLHHSTDSGHTWATISNIFQPFAVGFGATKPGGAGNAQILTVGWYQASYTSGSGSFTITLPTGLTLKNNSSVTLNDGSNNGCYSANLTAYNSGTGVATGTCGLTAGTGVKATGTAYILGVWGSDDVGSTWQELSPLLTFDQPRAIAGDPGVWNRAYLSLSGSGFAQINYLLNRDLDPASNDNSPWGLSHVA